MGIFVYHFLFFGKNVLYIRPQQLYFIIFHESDFVNIFCQYNVNEECFEGVSHDGFIHNNRKTVYN